MEVPKTDINNFYFTGTKTTSPRLIYFGGKIFFFLKTGLKF